jgi:hypothetical protein
LKRSRRESPGDLTGAFSISITIIAGWVELLGNANLLE